LDKILNQLQEPERQIYTTILCKIVGIRVGGHGQYYGDLSRLVFATEEQKAEAFNRLSSEIIISGQSEDVAKRYAA